MTRPLMIVLLALGSAAAAAEEEPDATPPARVVLKGAVEVPLVDPGIARSTLPVVEVKVNGRGPFRFAVETGAAFVGVSPGFADKAGLPRAGGPDEAPAYKVDAIDVGAASFRGLVVTAMPRGAAGVDGILGLSFFRDVLVTVDYPARRLRLERGSLPAPNGRDVLPLTRVGPFWGLPLGIGDKPFVGVLDTRGMGGLSVSPETGAGLRFDGQPRVVGRAGGAGLPETEIKAGRLDGDVRIGAYTVRHPTIVLHALPPDFPKNPIVGDAVLRNFAVTLDQRHARLRLARGGSPAFELDPPARGGSPLDAYAGRYGDRTLSVRDGKLFLQRPGGPQLELVPSGPDAFGLAAVPAAKIEFMRDAAGKVAAIRVLRDGTWETAARDAE